MPKNIEMNILDNGNYDVLYPASKSEIIYNSEHLKNLWNLSDGSDIDDAFDYIERKLILLQYNKAGINVTLKTSGGNPLEGIPINGITANYDGTGSCVTNSEGKCFGYCDAGSVTISCNNYIDIMINSQQVQTIATEMYDVELTGNNFVNFKRWTSTPGNIIFSNNVQSIDVTCVGGGGSGGAGAQGLWSYRSGGGGGGGYVSVQENVPFLPDTSYNCLVGAGATSSSVSGNNAYGGTSSFLNILGNGGTSGVWGKDDGAGGAGNGKGGNGVYSTNNSLAGLPGEIGGVMGYFTFTDTVLYGGGGGSGAGYVSGFDLLPGGKGAGYGGNGGNYNVYQGTTGQDGFGGGGGGGLGMLGNDNTNGGGRGGSGCVAIRMHLKVTS